MDVPAAVPEITPDVAEAYIYIRWQMKSNMRTFELSNMAEAAVILDCTKKTIVFAGGRNAYSIVLLHDFSEGRVPVG